MAFRLLQQPKVSGMTSKAGLHAHLQACTNASVRHVWRGTPLTASRFASSSSKRWDPLNARRASLVLDDGSVFSGLSFGYEGDPVVGEVVFTTGMVGYPESMTDPSYRGQILAMTYPLIGNYGVPPHVPDKQGLLKNFESEVIQTPAILCQRYVDEDTHWNAETTLREWCQKEKCAGLAGIDTRKLTKRLRSRGAMLGKILFDGQDDVELSSADPLQRNLVSEVSTKTIKKYGKSDLKIIAVDCGMKHNIIRHLVNLGCEVTVVPWDYDFVEEMRGKYHGIFVSNGPGDPSKAQATIRILSKAMQGNVPMFGICMGNQLMALAAGAQTYKLPFGNRGQNQPCMDMTTSRVYITPQNHGFAVDNHSLPKDWQPYFINTNDGSNEGIICTKKPFFSVQFHPEARGGPEDTEFLFDKFLSNAVDFKKNSANAHYSSSTEAGGPGHVKKALILGSGGLQIGQAGEFDYSGSQAIKALKEEGVETVLVNPNIATIQTSEGLADQTYFLPVTPEYLNGVIEKEKPDGILLGFGGQTGLNCGLELDKRGILADKGVRVLGTQVSTIETAEDRELFKEVLDSIGEPMATSQSADTVKEALDAAEKIGYPVVCRAAFALGGLGSGFAHSREELEALVKRALSSSPQVLIEKSIKGWKEVEYEVVRDANDNCLTVCNMENFDPMGLHTGESIVVAPSQTLTNDEYHLLRSAAIRVVRALGIIGECNIQYALNPHSEEYAIIEVNPRLSRSSALASKATGYPLAAVAAKLSLGIGLPNIRNAVTKQTTACFEPSLDYCVVKMPRWDLRKFTNVSPLLGTGMKSVGEVMSIGRSFEESLQKAIRMVDTANTGFEQGTPYNDKDALEEELQNPTDRRIFALAEAFDLGYTVDQLHDMTKIDKWFLHRLEDIKNVEREIRGIGNLRKINRRLMHDAKKLGFSDEQIGRFTNEDEFTVRDYRKGLGVLPIVKQIDTLAGEFPAETNYLYVTYNGLENDVKPNLGGVMTLGSGVYRIGSSVEFDYCSVSTVQALRKHNVRTVVINYNPETVSTDYDESDALYFEELSVERVMDIYDFENPQGVVVSMGGQQPQNIVTKLDAAGANILGTSAKNIDNCEDREKYSKMLDDLGIGQPAWKELSSMEDAYEFANDVGYPVLVRPSYVLSGAAMKVARTEAELTEFLGAARDVSPEHPVVMTKFVEGCQEVECDAVAQDGKLINWAVAVHIENAGVHSGDACHVLPCELSDRVKVRVIDTVRKIAEALEISGPCNTQFLLTKEGELLVIETNLRASRSFPFVSKTIGVNFIETATRVFLGHQLEPDPKCNRPVDHVCVKAPQFSFQRLLGSDPVLGVEMASTGEVACYGKDMHEAFLKAMHARHDFNIPQETLFVTGGEDAEVLEGLQRFSGLGYKIFATDDWQGRLQEAGVESTHVPQGEAVEFLKQKSVECVITVPYFGEDSTEYRIRRTAADFGISILNNAQLVNTLSVAVEKYGSGVQGIVSWQELWQQ